MVSDTGALGEFVLCLSVVRIGFGGGVLCVVGGVGVLCVVGGVGVLCVGVLYVGMIHSGVVLGVIVDVWVE